MRTRVVSGSGVGPSKPMPTPTAPPTPTPVVRTRNPFDDTSPGVPPATHDTTRPFATHTTLTQATHETVPPFATHTAPGSDPTTTAPPASAPRPLDGAPDVRTSGTRSAEWTRMVLPSKMLPYAYDAVWVRPLDIGVLSLLDAARRSGSFTTLVDALNHCIDVDIRELTPADFYFLMYWIRDNSYPHRALVLNWRSQYGNDNVTRVRLRKTLNDMESWREMRIIELDMTAAEVAAYTAQGLTFPTVRDMELLKSGTVEDADLWRVEYAQYVVPTPPTDPARPYDGWLQRKLDALHALGLGGVSAIDAFTTRITHGVEEFLHVVDEHYDPLVDLTRRRDTIAQLVVIVNNILADDPDNLYSPTLTRLLERIEVEKTRLDAMTDTLNAGEALLPEQEVITLDIVVMDFFPEVQS